MSSNPSETMAEFRAEAVAESPERRLLEYVIQGKAELPSERIAPGTDVRRLLGRLLTSGRFCHDTIGGGILHSQVLSVREVSPTYALHVTGGEDGRLAVHVDRLSPVAQQTAAGATCRYSWKRIIAHLALHLAWRINPALQIWRRELDAANILGAAEETASEFPSWQTACERAPFRPLDEAIHHLDSAAEPLAVHVEARISGTVDELRLRTAVGAALARHPKARVRLAIPTHRQPRFIWEVPPEPDIDPVDVVECHDDNAVDAARAEFQSLLLPLMTSPPLRVRLARHSEGDVIMLNLNHAVGDGVAGLRLLRSIAEAYAGEPQPNPEAFPADPPLRAPHPLVRRLRTLLGGLRVVAKSSVRIAPDGGDDHAGYGFCLLTLTEDHTNDLIKMGKHDKGITDLLLAAFHAAIAEWNAEYGERDGRIAILTGANLRLPPGRHEGVDNFSLMVPVVTHPQDRTAPAKILDVICERTQQVSNERLPAAFADLVSRLRYMPLRLKQAIVDLAQGFLPTAILSDLGRIEDIDFGSKLGAATGVWFSPPARMPCALGLGAVIHTNQLYLSFRYRHPQFGEAQAAQFAGHYVTALKELTNAPS
ncbi:MAG: hypothetical protein M3252_02310 [Actinomycetota bacterium]|nr:hypothetical protein [Actinomycetota bacterium]